MRRIKDQADTVVAEADGFFVFWWMKWRRTTVDGLIPLSLEAAWIVFGLLATKISYYSCVKLFL